MEVLTCEQGSHVPEWVAARLGLLTASMFGTVMAKGRGGGESKTRRTYMLKLIGECMTGEPADNYTNSHMERGKEMEAEARSLYELITENEVTQVGFIRNGDVGCSPDGLIGQSGMVEIKTKLPHLQLDVLLRDELPPEHRAQIQGQMMVAEREWCDFVSYWPALPPFIKRVERDDEYIPALEAGATLFLDQMAELTDKIKAM